MLSPSDLKKLICTAFGDAAYPGDRCLRGSDEGEEPYLLEKEFRGKRNWRTLDAAFIDQAPEGFGSALSFFSIEAFRFYIPAYLIADIDGVLERQNPVFHLTHGVEEQSRAVQINPQRYGNRTWFEHAQAKFALFSNRESNAIVEYLRHCGEAKASEQTQYPWRTRNASFSERKSIRQALELYWLARANS